MGAVGSWAGGVSEALIAIPPLLRLRPLMVQGAGISDNNKAPGELCRFDRACARVLPVSVEWHSGGVNVTLKIAPGEYVAIRVHRRRKVVLVPALAGVRATNSPEVSGRAVLYDGKSIEDAGA